MRAVVFAALVLMVACARQEPRSEITGPEVEAVQAVLEDINAAVEARDAARAASHYGIGSLIAVADRDLVVAPEIPAYYQSIVADQGSRLAFGQYGVTVASAHDVAYSWGEYNEFRHDPRTHLATHASGNFLVTLERRNGAWTIIQEAHTPLVRGDGESPLH